MPPRTHRPSLSPPTGLVLAGAGALSSFLWEFTQDAGETHVSPDHKDLCRPLSSLAPCPLPLAIANLLHFYFVILRMFSGEVSA